MFRLHVGWMETDRDQDAVIIPIWRKGALERVKLILQSTAKDDHRCTELQLEPSCAIEIFEQVKYRMIPTNVAFLAELRQKLPLEAASELASDI
jgi:hypothetical protein